MASSSDRDLHLVWKRETVAGRTALYGEAGSGVPVVFLHGWGLGQHSYKQSLHRLARLGCRVLAPALPGFGGTAELPGDSFSMPGYAEWVDEFLDVLRVDEPVYLVGHSFGGGLAIQVAHDYPERIRTLVLVNSLGAPMEGRPLWDWGIHFPTDLLSVRQLTRVLPVVLEDAVPNFVRNPRAFVKVANLARSANLTAELEELQRRGTPVVVLWGKQDRIITPAAFDALCASIGASPEVLAGNHSWLLADPDAFGEVMTNVVQVADLARSLDTG